MNSLVLSHLQTAASAALQMGMQERRGWICEQQSLAWHPAPSGITLPSVACSSVLSMGTEVFDLLNTNNTHPSSFLLTCPRAPLRIPVSPEIKEKAQVDLCPADPYAVRCWSILFWIIHYSLIYEIQDQVCACRGRAHYSLIVWVACSNTSVLIQSSTEMCYLLQETY